MRREIVFRCRSCGTRLEQCEDVPADVLAAWALGGRIVGDHEYISTRWAGDYTLIPDVLGLRYVDPYSIDVTFITDANTTAAQLHDPKKMIDDIPQITWPYEHSIVIIPFLASGHKSSWMIMGHQKGNTCLLNIESTIKDCHVYLESRSKLGHVMLAVSKTDRVFLLDDGDWAVARLRHD